MNQMILNCIRLFNGTFSACMELDFFRILSGLLVFYMSLGMLRLISGLRRGRR